ncbi:hypothetical protein JCM11641_004615 [Rhodosporidiobolus odoratus]
MQPYIVRGVQGNHSFRHKWKVDLYFAIDFPQLMVTESIDLPLGRFWLSVVYVGDHIAVYPRDWTAVSAASRGKYAPHTHRAYRLIIELEQPPPPDAPQSPPPDLAKQLAQRMSILYLEQLLPNLRVFFPNVHDKGAELWLSAKLAFNNSPYMKELLSSDFVEALPQSRKRPRRAKTPSSRNRRRAQAWPQR